MGLPAIEPLELTIYASVDREGTTYALSPHTRRDIAEALGSAVHLRSRVFISHETNADLQDTHSPVRGQVVMLLTGVSEDRLGDIGIVRFRDPDTDNIIE